MRATSLFQANVSMLPAEMVDDHVEKTIPWTIVMRAISMLPVDLAVATVQNGRFEEV